MASFHPLTPRKCPPDAEASLNGEYYRIVYHDPPTADDFEIWIFEPGNYDQLVERTKKRDCKAFALSMFTTEGKLRPAGMFISVMRKKGEIRGAGFFGWAKVIINPELGVLQQTGKNEQHHSLWPYVPCELEKHVIEVEGI